MSALGELKSRSGMRLGLMGGTFDPVHIGHLVAAEEALERFALDEVLFIPTGTPPHKASPATSAEIRYLLVAVATGGHPHLWVSRLEVDREETDYTVDTLVEVRRELDAASALFFITGADAVLEMASWKHPERVLKLCTVIAAARPGYDLANLEPRVSGIPGWESIATMAIPPVGVSSTEIRARVAAGRSIRYLVPDDVRLIIEKLGLYRGATQAETRL